MNLFVMLIPKLLKHGVHTNNYGKVYNMIAKLTRKNIDHAFLKCFMLKKYLREKDRRLSKRITKMDAIN